MTKGVYVLDVFCDNPNCCKKDMLGNPHHEQFKGNSLVDCVNEAIRLGWVFPHDCLTAYCDFLCKALLDKETK